MLSRPAGSLKEAKTERNTKALGSGRDPGNLDSTGSMLCIAGKAVYLQELLLDPYLTGQ